jgi:septum formation protein
VAGAVTAIRVILASASPRRRELLSLIGIVHEVRATNVEESVLPGELPAVYAERVARAKAAAADCTDANTVVVAADTVVVIDDLLLGKPHSRDDAARMLAMLSGRTHTVHTGVAVRRGNVIRSGLDTVLVTFRQMLPEEITRYIHTGEPMDKAGSYGIQGFGATLVERIEGDYFAVMGLSLLRTTQLLRELGVPYNFGPL